MLNDYIKGNTQFLNSVATWEEAIRISAQPLLDKGYINSQYVQDMIDNVNINGPYIIIVPGIAMPHAINKGGVLNTGISFLKLGEPVLFPQDKAVSILFVLAAEDSTGHLELISDLSSLLINEEVLAQFTKATNEEEILSLIDSVK